jgi:hypothetical protein
MPTLAVGMFDGTGEAPGAMPGAMPTLAVGMFDGTGEVLGVNVVPGVAEYDGGNAGPF